MFNVNINVLTDQLICAVQALVILFIQIVKLLLILMYNLV